MDSCSLGKPKCNHLGKDSIPCEGSHAELGQRGAMEEQQSCGMTAASHSPFTCTKDVFSLLFFLTVLVC